MVAPHHLRLQGQSLCLDCGTVALVTWPHAGALAAQVNDLVARAWPVVRCVGGALIEDLSLWDNLMLEPFLDDGVLPPHLQPEMDVLFARAGCKVQWSNWGQSLPVEADALVVLQVQIGRALAADPDVLLIDAAQWIDSLIAPERFSQSFAAQYPWRTLVWAACSAARARELRLSLASFLQELPA